VEGSVELRVIPFTSCGCVCVSVWRWWVDVVEVVEETMLGLVPCSL